LQGNSLTGTLPEELGYLASLEYLGVSANKFQGTLPATLGGIDHLGEPDNWEKLLTCHFQIPS
jgi:hypothetical protein